MQPSKSGPLWSGLQTTHFFTLSSPVLLSKPSWLGSKYFLCPHFLLARVLDIILEYSDGDMTGAVICSHYSALQHLRLNVKIQKTPLYITSLHRESTWNNSVFKRRFLVHLAEVFDDSQISVTEIEMYSLPSNIILLLGSEEFSSLLPVSFQMAFWRPIFRKS